MHRLTPVQTSLFVATEVLPGVLILLPAAMGGLQKLMLLCADYLGTPVPDHIAQAAALVATAGLAGVAKVRPYGGWEWVQYECILCLRGLLPLDPLPSPFF